MPLATTYRNLGFLHLNQGNLEHAETYLSRAVQIEERIGHPDLEHERAMLERIRKRLKTPS